MESARTVYLECTAALACCPHCLAQGEPNARILAARTPRCQLPPDLALLRHVRHGHQLPETRGNFCYDADLISDSLVIA